uniref:NADH-ubiquinone oxidoreductase chain 5 n=1 Tax=Osedax rubiplumus TaxID=283784 RepID=A0A6M4AHD0_OSERU|nr:NADH dehydrogenase subunit 5 [Osedax rubiplumus]
MTSLKSSLMMFTLFICVASAGLYFTSASLSILLSWHLLTISSVTIKFYLILDSYSLLFSSVVLFISGNVLMFAKTYMSEEIFLKRFTFLILCFILSMNLLIFSPHLMFLLLGWDGLGLSSFLLIIYYQNYKSLSAGIFTTLTNRIGDVLILLSIGMLVNQNSWLFFNFWNNSYSMLVMLSLMFASMTKSAQIPFSSWLPAAMEAPTPVSALVHSSTLVTGGIFLLIRFFPMLSQYNMFFTILLIMSSLTMLMSGITAISEFDLKKIIALSTLSQLGLMMMSLALNSPSLTFFHLLTHALFKALLFITAGVMIYNMSHNQDLRLLNLSFSSFPITSSALLIASMSLAGAPFLSGFYSKDLILEETLFMNSNPLIFLIAFLATSLTAFYSLRLMSMLFCNSSNASPLSNFSESDPFTISPMIMMSIMSVMGGAMLNWLIIMPNWTFFIPLKLKLLTPMVTLAGFSLSWFLMNSSLTKFNHANLKLLSFSSMMWFLSPVSSQLMITEPLKSSHFLYYNSDAGWTESFTSAGLTSTVSSLSSFSQLTQANVINKFLLMNILWLPLLF